MKFFSLLIVVLSFCSGIASGIQSKILFDGSGITEWSTGRDDQRLAKEFSASELRHATDPASLQWRFIPKDVGFNDVFLKHIVTRRFDTIRVRLKNEGESFILACKVSAADGAEWTANRVTLKAGEDWRWIEFQVSEWIVAPWSKDANGKLDFPLSSFALIAFNIKTGLEYKLRISNIEVIHPDPPVVTVRNLKIPTEMQAGKSYPFSLTFRTDRQIQEDDACLLLKRDGRETFRQSLCLPTPLSKLVPGQDVDFRAELNLPEFVPGGKQCVVLRLADTETWMGDCVADNGLAVVNIEQRHTGKTIAAVKKHNGTPTLFINGKPHNGMMWATYRPTSAVFRDFTEAGINLYTFAATPTESGYGLSRTAWTAPGKYDFSQLDERAQMLLKENPNAYFFPRLYLHAPKWWSEQHPDDIVLMDPGDGRYVPFIHSGGKPAPSWASDTWRKDTIEGLRRLIAHVEASPYADRVIGYHLASGTTEEWMMWGGNENQWVDYSPANTARFRKWLSDKYRNDAALKAAWHNDTVSLDTAVIPTKVQRQQTEFGILRDPVKEQAVIDYYLYNSDLVADTICTFARAVKKSTKRRKVVGIFYGYLLQLCGEHRQQNAGHLALAKVLASPDVDFLTSPTSYAFRKPGGEGTSHFMSLFASVKLHGKLWFDENDIRTSMAPGAPGTWGKPENIAGDIIQQEKELANVIVNGSAQWWFDVGSNVYSNKALMARIGKLTVNATESLKLDRSSVDETAMIVDEQSLCYMKVGDPMGARLLVSQLPAMARIGAPVGHYLVTDLPLLSRHKVFFIMTSFAPTAEDRAAIESLKRDGHVLVFIFAPGIYRNGQLDETGMTEFTGIKMRMTREEGECTVKLAAVHRLTKGIEGQSYGEKRRGFPVCYVDDETVKVLGTLPDGKAGLVIKEGKAWTSIFSSAPMLPAQLMRNIVQLAGVHTYIDTEDVVWVSKNMLAICVKEAGKRTVKLPAKSAVHDLYSGEIIGKDISAFDADFTDRATRVFVIE